MEYSPDEVNVSDPVYVVRKRLGDALADTDSREEQIENMDSFGKQIDEEVYNSIVTDYEQEVGDVLSDFDGGGMLGDMGGPAPMGAEGFEDEEDMSEEEEQRRMKKFMRVSSLQIAYQAYPVFKSIVVN